ncbi:MAG: agmatine deiminase family protein [Acidobacteria bacterium]|nr:agmatine deiminase family protein [Acidobacteriota bacterium]
MTRSRHYPIHLGYRMPAEWEPHAATWIAWPHNIADWPGKFAAIPWAYAEIVRHLAGVERVEILVNDAVAEARARRVLEQANAPVDAVRFHRWPTNRGWTRDCGPVFLTRKGRARRGLSRLALTNWRFNGWAKYPDWQKDNAVPEKMHRWLRMRVFRPTAEANGKPRHVVLEGGSIDVNGRGTLMTTEECLLSTVQQRNPGMDRADIERVLGNYLGIRKVLWLGGGIVGDDTHGHVDDIARFVAPRTVVAAVEHDPADPNHAPLAENLRRLKSMTDQDGRRLRVVALPMPGPIIFRGRRLPASYANFYIANRLVLVPTFNDANDRVALNILAGLFPDRRIVGIYCGDFIWGFGAIHCMTQQQPA